MGSCICNSKSSTGADASVLERQPDEVPSCNGVEPWSDLLDAISNDDVERVRMCVESRPNTQVNWEGDFGNGETALTFAILSNKKKVLEYLVREKMVNVNRLNSQEVSPIFLAACQGNLDVVRFLFVEGNANIDAPWKYGITPIFMAAQSGHLEIVRFLAMEAHADVNKARTNGATPLCIASGLGMLEIVKFLVVEAKAAVHQGTGMTTPLHLATEQGHLEIVRFLLLEANADANENNDMCTPLHLAAQKGHLEVMQCLVLEGKAHVNKADEKGCTPLFLATLFGMLDSVKFLALDCKADSRMMPTSQPITSPLHIACAKNFVEIAKTLIFSGADVNLKNSAGLPPIFDACEGGDLEIVEVLLDARADPKLHCWNENTILHIATFRKKLEITKRIAPFFECLDFQNSYGCTPLHLAAMSGSKDIVQWLLANGANGNILSFSGNTALHYAVQNANEDIIAVIAEDANTNTLARNLVGANPHDLYNVMYPGKESLPLKMIPLSNSQVEISASKFVYQASKSLPSINLEHVKLIQRSIWLEADLIPHYSLCESSGWHHTASDVRPSDEVLFVSHRWGSLDLPDPTQEQYLLTKHFLLTQGKNIAYIWADYSCICQDKETELFQIHLTNIPTAVWVSTHCIIIPKLDQLQSTESEAKIYPVSNLNDYLSRAWCVLEAMAALLTGSKCFLALQVAGCSYFEAFDAPEGSASKLGFSNANQSAWEKVLEKADEIPPGIAAQVNWDADEPCAIIALLIKMMKSKDSVLKEVVERGRNQQLCLEDADGRVPILQRLWDMLGNCAVEKDKVPVMNLMIAIGYYSMYLFQAVNKESTESFSQQTDTQHLA